MWRVPAPRGAVRHTAALWTQTQGLPIMRGPEHGISTTVTPPAAARALDGLLDAGEDIVMNPFENPTLGEPPLGISPEALFAEGRK